MAVVVLLVATASCASPPPPAPDELSPLVGLVVERLDTADAVAASKWRTGGSIVDPPREQAVIDAARAGAVARGLDPDAVAAFFRDQIEASKVVQYGLFSAWSADPRRAPAAAPDLSGIRPELDRLTGQLLDALAATRPVRTGPTCPAVLGRAVDDAATHHPVDPTHRRGLDRALASTCR